MKNLLMALIATLVTSSLFAQEGLRENKQGYTTIRNYTIEAVRSVPPAMPERGAQFLVGANPSGAWMDHENEIARWVGSAWTFLVPTPADQAFDEAGRQYLYTGVATLFDGLWLDSQWRELTPFMAKWKTGLVINGPYTIAADDHATWLVVTPGGPDLTITLPNAFLPPISGMRFILELDCSTNQTISLEVAGGGILQHPDGTQTVASFPFDASACSNDSFVYEVIAGNTTTRAQWYIVPQQGPATP